MLNPHITLIGVGRPGFDIELGTQHYLRAAATLERLGAEVTRPPQLLTDPDEVTEWIRTSADPRTDGVVVLLATFVDGRFVARVAGGLAQPIFLWSLPEPDTHGRLRLNALTGLNSASFVLSRLGRAFAYLNVVPDGEPPRQLLAWLRAATAASRLRSTKIGVVGTHPPGFFASDADGLRLQKVIGPTVVQVNLETLLRQSADVGEPLWKANLKADAARVADLDRLDPEQLRKSSQFTVTLEQTVQTLGLQAVAVRCWPEFFSPYGAVACSTLAHLNDAGVPAACEADVLGAVSMTIEHLLAQSTVFLGDLVQIREDRNSVVFWHCGAGAISLASPRTGAVAGVQPNRNLAYAFNNPLKAGTVTICRLGQTDDGYRMLIARGKARDDSGHFFGTSVEVEVECDAREVLPTVIGKGFEFHFAIVWDDIVPELEQLSALLGIPALVLGQKS
jgi:L-fucose isomerase-like protein